MKTSSSASADKALWRRVFPLVEPAYRYAMNVRPLAPPCLTERTAHHDTEVALKRAIDADPRRVPFAELPDSRDAQVELCGLLLAERPDIKPPDPQDSTPPLLAAARQVQEDFILLREDDAGALRVIAGALHFPSVWRLTDKLGQEFLAVHAPVRGFADAEVGEKSRLFLKHLRPGRPVWRSNWTLQATDRLDTSPEVADDWIAGRRAVTRENAAAVLHLRIEYQKLFRLPTTGAVVFSIHTLLVPLPELAGAEPEAGLTLGALRSLDAEVARYKGLDGYLETACAVLADLVAS